MSYYEKIPVIIEAWEMTKNNIIEMYSLVNKIHKEEITEQEKDKIIENSLVWGLDIPTLEDGEDRRAKHVASIGDYIIKGLQGEYYPVKPDIFKMSYRLVDDDNYLKKQLRDVTVDIQEIYDYDGNIKGNCKIVEDYYSQLVIEKGKTFDINTNSHEVTNE